MKNNTSEVPIIKTKNKAVNRISRLFQKKPKIKATLTSSVSSLSISDPVLNKQPSLSNVTQHNLHSPETKHLPPIPSQQEPDDMTSIESVSANTSLEKTLSLKSDSTQKQQQQTIDQRRALLRELEAEKAQDENENKRLEDQLNKLQKKVKQRAEDMKILENNYQLHLQSMRCSDNDPKSISIQLIELRAEIKKLAQELLPFAEPKTTTEKLSTLWLNLTETIERLGDPYLSPERILLLTEKFMMDVLVQNLNTNHFPGLSCHAEFLEIQDWFDHHDPSSFFLVRLRQELSLLIVNSKTDDVEERRKKSVERNWHHIYRGLQKSYPKSYLSAPADNVGLLKKQQAYSLSLRQLVEKVVDLGYAIKGQEAYITAMDVKEGVQTFDANVMEDEDGQKSGTIALCISPPFVIKVSDHYEPLVKGRVLCFPELSTDAASHTVNT
ncbi:hypothetical protein G6F46_008512 [Rhizopus delemar]|nr:hypothetical protein G6F54_008032 [Rhizopus delemar]KAG1539916.1 hypothetical protein G6F51_008844 [Rhizopus arrhizus]KAG1508326.1 hypothetical protein G6F53_008281 [Rhizopus delemar]KAG1567213.1 hypothetical protein G6F50_008420 [Rhizopus delemar]KAG1585865.1 hypothetical protein G6F48_006984 [Rhizopus delemar]